MLAYVGRIDNLKDLKGNRCLESEFVSPLHPQSETSSLKPQTPTPKPQTPNPKPQTQNAKPQTPSFELHTQNTNPLTLQTGSSAAVPGGRSETERRTHHVGQAPHRIVRLQASTQGPSWGYLKVNFSETLSIFGDEYPQNGSKNGQTAPRTGTGCPHEGPRVGPEPIASCLPRILMFLIVSYLCLCLSFSVCTSIGPSFYLFIHFAARPNS